MNCVMSLFLLQYCKTVSCCLVAIARGKVKLYTFFFWAIVVFFFGDASWCNLVCVSIVVCFLFGKYIFITYYSSIHRLISNRLFYFISSLLFSFLLFFTLSSRHISTISTQRRTPPPPHTTCLHYQEATQLVQYHTLTCQN